MEDWKAFMSTKSRDDNTEDFEEEDMWSHSHYNHEEYQGLSSSSSSSSAWKNCNKTTPKSIPRRAQTTPKHEAKVKSSAPMKIPDWSKIYGKGNYASWVSGDHGDDDGDDVVPPHEWIARKLARSQISSFSVCEGIGRTLKGRDLSKVRNAILTKTGFLE